MSKSIQTFLFKFVIGVGIGLLVVVLTHVLDFEFLRDIDFLTIDYRFQQRGVTKNVYDDGNVVVVEISDEDLVALPERFPFPRSYYAHVIENLNRAGARTIVLDITFDSDGRGDDTLRQILRQYGNVVLGVKAAPEEGREQYAVRSLERQYSNVFYDVDKRVGIVNVLFDRDNVVRRYLPKVYSRGFFTPTLAFGALNDAFGFPPESTAVVMEDFFAYRDRLIPKYDDQTFMLNYYGPVKTFRYVPFSHVINDESFWTKDELEIEVPLDTFDENMMSLFEGKIVIIGSTMAEERDIHTTPMINPDGVRTMNGVEIHATAVQNIIDRNFVTHAPAELEIPLIFVLSIVVFFLILQFKQLKLRFVALLEVGSILIAAVFIAAIAQLGVLWFSSDSVLMNLVNPSLAVVFAYVGTIVYQYLVERQQKAYIKNVFSHYISKDVVNELVANPEKATLGGDKRELTVFFSDVADFTTISESLTPEGLVVLLNEYLDEMTSIILAYGGTLDKYEGDAIMAFWGAPVEQPDHALRACHAALEMQNRLAILRGKWRKVGKPPLEVRAGLNTGHMIVGNMGGRERFDYTVIGDSVNLASRLEGANKQYKSDIMISDMTYKHVEGKVLVRELDLIQVKGKTEPVKVWHLLGPIDMERTDKERQALEIYHEGLKLYRERNWAEAIGYMQQAKELDPECHVAEIYAQRAGLYQLNPPPDDWNGVFVMTTK